VVCELRAVIDGIKKNSLESIQHLYDKEDRAPPKFIYKPPHNSA
jgi:hypothetical protein